MVGSHRCIRLPNTGTCVLAYPSPDFIPDSYIGVLADLTRVDAGKFKEIPSYASSYTKLSRSLASSSSEPPFRHPPPLSLDFQSLEHPRNDATSGHNAPLDDAERDHSTLSSSHRSRRQRNLDDTVEVVGQAHSGKPDSIDESPGLNTPDTLSSNRPASPASPPLSHSVTIMVDGVPVLVNSRIAAETGDIVIRVPTDGPPRLVGPHVPWTHSPQPRAAPSVYDPAARFTAGPEATVAVSTPKEQPSAASTSLATRQIMHALKSPKPTPPPVDWQEASLVSSKTEKHKSPRAIMSKEGFHRGRMQADTASTLGGQSPMRRRGLRETRTPELAGSAPKSTPASGVVVMKTHDTARMVLSAPPTLPAIATGATSLKMPETQSPARSSASTTPRLLNSPALPPSPSPGPLGSPSSRRPRGALRARPHTPHTIAGKTEKVALPPPSLAASLPASTLPSLRTPPRVRPRPPSPHSIEPPPLVLKELSPPSSVQDRPNSSRWTMVESPSLSADSGSEDMMRSSPGERVRPGIVPRTPVSVGVRPGVGSSRNHPGHPRL
ncbi:hypothetical protein J8273_0781 [Carpediemonas membranifera]|uniref:Uncharacterized protein n=1 Tax=Carpediemonas membranifera TaxID=201153 RepID=A0A8J6AY14_9EUKA|nr:hypothetical protein J8273_0781 [Carpediemonas membranifera]|eukprot:KAG9397651.1 hypothetical protein J8273_0781 [Carpediemonas membranifera]